MNTTVKGTLLASAMAGLFACASTKSNQSPAADNAAGGGDQVKCMGINECKGHSACKGVDNTCKGENECMGKGWVKTGKEDCNSKGGTILE